MASEHPDPEALDHFVAGRLNPRETRRLAWHLLNCHGCRRAAGASEDGRRVVAEILAPSQPAAPRPADYDGVISRSYSHLLDREAELERERGRAPQLYAELMRHPVTRQRVLVENTRRFQNWGLAEYLLARSAKAWLEQPAGAEDLATLALAVTERLQPTPHSEALLADLKGRCWVHVANSRRVLSDLPGAEQGFVEAERYLRQGTDDPLEWARMRFIKASLRRDQLRFGEAGELLRRAAVAYRRVGEQHEVGKALFLLSTVHRAQGEPEKAIAVLRKAMRHIDPQRDPQLVLGARHNLILLLTESGRFMEAQALLARSRDLYRSHANGSLKRRLPWLKAKVAFGLGQLDQAEAAFLVAREAFLEQGAVGDAALVSLELAMVYARQGRTQEVKALARSTVPIFQAIDVHREALAAFLLFKEAAEAEQATVALLREVAERVKAVAARS
jgi:tetratricopeptide (TPR) repeat protein